MDNSADGMGEWTMSGSGSLRPSLTPGLGAVECHPSEDPSGDHRRVRE